MYRVCTYLYLYGSIGGGEWGGSPPAGKRKRRVPPGPSNDFLPSPPFPAFLEREKGGRKKRDLNLASQKRNSISKKLDMAKEESNLLIGFSASSFMQLVRIYWSTHTCVNILSMCLCATIILQSLSLLFSLFSSTFLSQSYWASPKLKKGKRECVKNTVWPAKKKASGYLTL